MKKRLLSALCLALAAYPATMPAAFAQTSGIDKSNFDTTVRVQDDFFQHVNGGWLKRTKIPDDKARWGSFDELAELSATRVRELVEDIAKSKAKPGTDAAKIADVYNSFVDEAKREALGFSPLKADMARIAAIKDGKDLAAAFGHLARIGVDLPFGLAFYPDTKASEKNAVYASQSGLGLPNRDYYLKDEDAKLMDARKKYVAHVEAMLAMAGDKEAAVHAADILKLETELARAQWTPVENRNPQKTYNRTEFAKLGEVAPGFDWPTYLKTVGLEGRTDYIIVRQPSYFAAMGAAVQAQPLSAWKAYLQWKLIESHAYLLNKAAVAERFAFTGTALRGVKVNEPQWKLAVRTVEGAMGEAVGKQYVAKYFPPENKARMEKLIANVLLAFKDGIDELEWMGAETKKEAQAKLATFKPYVGYPDKFRDYSTLKTKKDDLVGNVRAARQHALDFELAKLKKPADRDEWSMMPQTVNAYYSPVRNVIVFPAAILQPPFFDVKADDAVNYGAIGAVIGHEIGHGFDDQGSQYDGQGNLRNWWTDDDRKKFTERASGLVKQYSAMCPLPGYCVNGQLSLGENIGDNSGLAIAYKAYKKSLNGQPSPVIDGYTGEQRFYLGFGQIWRTAMREEALLVQLKNGPHTPGQLRGPGAIVNQPGFYEAFDVKPTDKMYLAPEQRVKIW